MPTFNATNNDTAQATKGDIVKSSGQSYGVVPALANSPSLVLLGVWDEAPGVGKPGKVVDGLVEVNCVAAVNVGDNLYLDAVVLGKATKVAPVVPYFIGTVLTKRTEGAVQKATVIWKGGTASANVSLNGSPAVGTITCVKEVDDNDGFTLSDGVTSKTYEYRRSIDTYSLGTILAIAKSRLLDNETFTINDGVNAATDFEFQLTPNVKATGLISTVPVANLLNNETFTLNDGVHAATVFELKAVVDQVSVGSITATVKGNLLNNETFTLDDGVNPATVFEFQVDGAYAQVPGRVTVDVSATATPAEVIAEIKTAINGVVAGLAITGGAIVDATLALANDAIGAYNATITTTVANVAFVVSGMSGGSFFVATPGAVLVDVSAVATAPEVATAIETAVNGVIAGLAITATVDLVIINQVNLQNDADGPYNDSITDTVANAAFVHGGMSGGSSFTATPGTVVIDLTAVANTAPAVATAIKDAIQGVGGGLDITASVPADNTSLVNLQNDAYGFYNDAVTTTVADAGFVVTGLTGGEVWAATPGAVEINVRGIVTDQAIADITYGEIIAEAQDFNIPALTSRVINIQNKIVGVAGNVAITKTGGCPLVVTGMSNGVDSGAGGGSSETFTDVNVAGPYVVLASDDLLQVRRTSTSAITINLPALTGGTQLNGRRVRIKDSGYNCAVNNITIAVSNAADKIENGGAGVSYVQNVNGSCIWLIANTTTNNWEIV